jgi:hypothetical protein
MTCSRLRAPAWAGLGIVLVGLLGCGAKQAQVSGTVKFEGEPVAKGYISFLPDDGEGSTAGGTIEDGKYSVSGMAPGRKKVHVTLDAQEDAEASAKERGRSDRTKEMRNRGRRAAPDAVPKKLDGNDQVFELSTGGQELNLELAKGKGR